MTLQEFANSTTAKKALLVPRNVKENDILLYLCSGEKKQVVNLEVTSLEKLAYQWYVWKQAKNGNVVKKYTDEIGLFYTRTVMESQKLYYFKKEWLDMKTVAEVYHNLNLLRLNEPIDSQLEFIESVSEEDEKRKRNDLFLIKKCYEEMLDKSEYIDSAKIYSELLLKEVEVPSLLFYEAYAMEQMDYEKLSYMEKSFLNKLVKEEKLVLLPFEQKRDAEKLCSETVFFWGSGKGNEAAYIMEEILKEKYCFSDVLVMCPTEEYVEVVAEQAQRFGIPFVTSCFPIRHSAICSLLEVFVKYVESNYAIENLEKLMTMDGFRLKKCKEQPKEETLEEKHYIARRKVASIISKLGGKTGTKQFDYMLNQLDETADAYVETKNLLEELKEICRQKNERVSIREVAKMLRKFLVDFAWNYDNGNCLSGAYGAVLHMLDQKMMSCDCEVSYIEAIRYLEQCASEITIEKVEDIGITISNIASVRYINKPILFVVGMTGGSFPGIVNDSPILSDEERKQFGITELEKEKWDILIQRFNYALHLQEKQCKKRYFGYDRLSVKNVTEQVPCVLYGNLKKEVSKLAEGSFDFCDALKYINILGEMVEKGEENENLSERKGVEQYILNPSEGIGKTKYSVSATQMETLASCPMQYYLKYEKNIYNEEIKLQRGEWLPANEKGTLIHSILEHYVDKVYVVTPPIMDKEQRKECLKELIEEEFKNARTLRETTDELYDATKEYATEILLQYIEKIDVDGYQPLCSEYTFGEKKVNKYSGESIPISISLSKKNSGNPPIILKMDGTIDRVDCKVENGQKKYRILDYKTGKVKENDINMVQDYLYVKVWEQIKKVKVWEQIKKLKVSKQIKKVKVAKQIKKVKMEEAVYEYLYEGKTVKRTSSDWAEIEKRLQVIFERIYSDGYPAWYELSDREELENLSNIKYCPYTDICPKCNSKCGNPWKGYK